MAFAVLLGGCGGSSGEPDGPMDPRPDGNTPQSRLIAIGDTVNAQITSAMEPAWRFDGIAAQELNIFLQGLTGSSDSFSLWLPDSVLLTTTGALRRSQPGLGITSVVRSSGTDSDLEGQASGRFVLPSTKTYGLAVGGNLGPYRFWIYQVDRSPETAAATIPRGDTVEVESIDHVGDIDEFSFSAQAGEQFNVFLLASSGDLLANLWAQVPSQTNFDETTVLTSGSDTVLKRQASGTFTVESTGTQIVRVLGESSKDGRDRGSYRLLLFPIDWQPEVASTLLTVGDSVINESIELMGDVDEFVLDFSDTAEVNIVLEHTSDLIDDGLIAILFDDPTDTQLPDPQGRQSSRLLGSGLQVLDPALSYVVRVYGFSRVHGYDGSYELRVYRINRATEIIAAAVAIGDTVDGEVLDPLGDIDEFTFSGARGQHLTVYFQGTTSMLGGSFGLTVRQVVNDTSIAWAGTSTQQPNLTDRETGRFTLPADGTYKIRVGAGDFGRSPQEQGSYRFLVKALDAGPESVGSTVATGDTVSGESMDFLGDVDEFTLTGTPGTDVVMHFQNSVGKLTLEVVDPGTRTILGAIDSFTFVSVSGRFTFPQTGSLLIRVNEPRNCGFQPATCAFTFNNTGGYWFVGIQQ